jgi:hypothetical protein
MSWVLRRALQVGVRFETTGGYLNALCRGRSSSGEEGERLF